ncbi:hypothetical protein O181_072139 [Austropuccinia psidii MF-1]|uniref:Uncharacterized protein n=1 Tax=Austropuccinia psidii MF-1 TaxID=1389203 RepID=A0A9Q3F461_9BASI|nr:hypothetical protein [Austropuccinia psidii MF-1]
MKPRRSSEDNKSTVSIDSDESFCCAGVDEAELYDLPCSSAPIQYRQVFVSGSHDYYRYEAGLQRQEQQERVENESRKSESISDIASPASIRTPISPTLQIALNQTIKGQNLLESSILPSVFQQKKSTSPKGIDKSPFLIIHTTEKLDNPDSSHRGTFVEPSNVTKNHAPPNFDQDSPKSVSTTISLKLKNKKLIPMKIKSPKRQKQHSKTSCEVFDELTTSNDLLSNFHLTPTEEDRTLHIKLPNSLTKTKDSCENQSADFIYRLPSE